MLVIFCHLKEAAFGQDICTIGIEREGNQSDMHDSFNTEIVSTRVALNRFRMPFRRMLNRSEKRMLASLGCVIICCRASTHCAHTHRLSSLHLP